MKVQSKTTRSEASFRSLTRLILPIAFGEWCEERLAPGRKRARDLTQLIDQEVGPQTSTSDSAEPPILSDSLVANAIYQRLIRRLLVPGNSDWVLDDNSWKSQRDVLLPQVINSLITRAIEPSATQRRDGLKVEDITVLKLRRESTSAKKWIQGEVVSIKRSKELYFAFVEDIRLSLCSTGIALLELDLHLLSPSDFEAEERRASLADFTHAMHRCDADSQTELVEVRTRVTGLLQPAKAHLRPLASDSFEQSKSLALKDLDASLRGIAGHAMTKLKAILFPGDDDKFNKTETQRAWFEDIVERGQHDEQSKQHFVSELESVIAEVANSRTGKNGTTTHEQVESLSRELFAALLAVGTKTAQDGFHSWTPQDLVTWTLGQLGIPKERADRDCMRDVLTGDRFFVFSHINIDDDSVDWLGDPQVRHYAAQLARHHKKGTADFLVGRKGRYPGGCYVTEAKFCATALEGSSVIQVPGGNRHHQENLQGVRVRQFMLIRLGLLYRYSLLNLSFAGDDLRGLTGEAEIERIELLCQAVDEFGHRLYHGHISNFSHLQAFFDVVLKAFNVERLWDDLEKDLPRVLERRKLLIERQLKKQREEDEARDIEREKRRDHRQRRIEFGAQWLGLPLAAVLVLKELNELDEKLELGFEHFQDLFPNGWAFVLAWALGAVIFGGLVKWLARKYVDKDHD